MLDSLRIFRAAFVRGPSAHSTEDPIRGELYSAERLELHAESLAAQHAAYESRWGGYNLAAEARHNGTILLACHSAIAEAARQQRAITPAAEWVLDNFHVVDAQLKSIHQEFTSRSARSLAKLADGPLRGRPRAYAVAWDFIAHTDSRLDPELLRRFLHAYQRVTPLNMRELWALPLVLRCIMLDNLRRLAQRIVDSQVGRRDADKLADELETAEGEAPADLLDALRGMAQQPL